MLAATLVATFPSLDNFFGAVTADLSRPQRRHFCGYLISDDALVAQTGHHIVGNCGHRLDAKTARWGHRFVSALYVYVSRPACGP